MSRCNAFDPSTVRQIFSDKPFLCRQSQKPGPYVKEMNDAATFYTNRVLKDYKETQVLHKCCFILSYYILTMMIKTAQTIPDSPSDRRHVDWVRSYLSIWTEMQSYIKQYHTTGLVWSKSVSTTHSTPVFNCLLFVAIHHRFGFLSFPKFCH